MKKESMAEFLARGGKVTVCPVRVARGTPRKQRVAQEAKIAEQVNYSVIPASLKIALGIK